MPIGRATRTSHEENRKLVINGYKGGNLLPLIIHFLPSHRVKWRKEIITMEEFKPITTQEELNAVIGDRVTKARASERKTVEEEFTQKYADYDSIKSKLAEKENRITELGKELEQAKNAGSTNDEKIKELQAKVQKYESDSVKTRIAQELGLDAGLANRLTGETEEDIRKDAEALKGIVGSTSVQRINYNPESTAKDEENAALKNMLQAMKGE